MKFERLLITINIFLCCHATNAQKLPVFDKANAKTHFINLGNDIVIDVFEADASKITVKTAEGFLSKINDSLYNIRYNTPIDESKIRLYYKNLPVDVLIISVKNLPSPEIILLGKSGGKLNVADVKMVDTLKIFLPGEVDLSYSVELYTCNVILDIPGSKVQTFTLRNNVIPENLKAALLHSKSGTTLIFDQVRFKIGNSILNIEPKPVRFEIN